MQSNLESVAEVTVWDQEVCEPSSNVIDSLQSVLRVMDFGVIVLSADDIATIRSIEYKVTRDNVILEMGLFIATLGIERVAIIHPVNIGNFHYPSDITGTILLPYDPHRTDGKLIAALNTASGKIKKMLLSKRAGIVGGLFDM